MLHQETILYHLEQAFYGGYTSRELRFFGYIDVGDGSWGPNVLVASLRSGPDHLGDQFIALKKSPT